MWLIDTFQGLIQVSAKLVYTSNYQNWWELLQWYLPYTVGSARSPVLRGELLLLKKKMTPEVYFAPDGSLRSKNKLFLVIRETSPNTCPLIPDYFSLSSSLGTSSSHIATGSCLWGSSTSRGSVWPPHCFCLPVVTVAGFRGPCSLSDSECTISVPLTRQSGVSPTWRGKSDLGVLEGWWYN